MNSLAHPLRSQYRSALAMLKDAIERCPDAAWGQPVEGNRFWHMAYHVLFYTALYCSREENPVLWSGCREHHQILSANDWAQGYDPKAAYEYSKTELLEFIAWMNVRLNDCFDDASTDLPSEFSWISLSRLELYLYNLRHLQHHCGQLSERVKQLTGSGVSWVGRG